MSEQQPEKFAAYSPDSQAPKSAEQAMRNDPTERVLLIDCPDQLGIVARFTGQLYDSGANIVGLEQHVEEKDWFFMRIHAELPEASGEVRQKLEDELQDLGKELDGTVQIHDPKKQQRVAVLASTRAACPRELLIAQQSGRLAAKITDLISDHRVLEGLADSYSIPFRHVDTASGMEQAEETMLGLLKQSQPDLVVMARYMKILSEDFIDECRNRIINIHHSFLPAFKGNRPYHQAWDRGVKIIGATAHFATENLDDGQIIAQEVVPVTHQHSVGDMVQAGEDIEKRVLLNSVQAFLQHKIIIHNNRTILFH